MSTVTPDETLTIPKTQRQWQQTGRGLPKDVLKLVEDAPVPTPAKGEVLIKVLYATGTPAVYKLMGILPSFWRKGSVPEIEATGLVVDPNHSEFKKGDLVTGIFDETDFIKKKRGTLTEYALFRVSLYIVENTPPPPPLKSG